MGYYWGPYVSVAQKQAKAEKILKALKKKNPAIKPVTIEGKALAKTWWGKEWNKNLERYADYSNRIGRGRSYVRHSAVVDLQIKPGEVKALVLGSSSKPYSITVKIEKIPEKNWTEIKEACKGNMDSLQQLLEGKFPKALETLFTKKGEGLFPTPGEIDFSCSCPDWASMCKHVAAVLYGIGARLDEDPGLFFSLRKAAINDLISESVKESKKDLLTKAAKRSSRVIDDSGLSDLFGIDLGDAPENNEGPGPARKATLKPTVKKKPRPAKKTTSKKTVKKAAKLSSTTPQSRAVSPKKRASPKKTTAPVDVVRSIIKKNKKGIRVSDLIEKTDLDAQKVRNLVVKLKNQGEIENVSRGVYRMIQGDRK